MHEKSHEEAKNEESSGGKLADKIDSLARVVMPVSFLLCILIFSVAVWD